MRFSGPRYGRTRFRGAVSAGISQRWRQVAVGFTVCLADATSHKRSAWRRKFFVLVVCWFAQVGTLVLPKRPLLVAAGERLVGGRVGIPILTFARPGAAVG